MSLALAGRFSTTEPPRKSPTGAQRGNILQIHPLATRFPLLRLPQSQQRPPPPDLPQCLYIFFPVQKALVLPIRPSRPPSLLNKQMPVFKIHNP